jgi:hypothetical protein
MRPYQEIEDEYNFLLPTTGVENDIISLTVAYHQNIESRDKDYSIGFEYGIHLAKQYLAGEPLPNGKVLPSVGLSADTYEEIMDCQKAMEEAQS